MAKQFKIYFSESEETVKDTFDPETGEETVLIRRFEIELLMSIYMISARFQQAIPDSIECKDVVDQLKNIGDNDKYIELTKKDLDYAKTGWLKSAGPIRPYSWVDKGESIINQIHTPFDPEKIVRWDERSNKFIVVEEAKE